MVYTSWCRWDEFSMCMYVSSKYVRTYHHKVFIEAMKADFKYKYLIAKTVIGNKATPSKNVSNVTTLITNLIDSLYEL